MIGKAKNEIKNFGTYFDPIKHEYWQDGIKLGHVTGFIKDYVSEFKPVQTAKFVARHKGMSPAKLLKIWDILGDSGRAFGDFVHALAHLYLLDKETLMGYWGGMSPQAKVVVKMMDSITSKYEIVDMETPRFSKTYLIGYMLDLILKTKPGTEGHPKTIVADFKTTKITDNEDYRNFKEATSKAKKPANAKLMKSPFKELGMREVPFDKVAIQLSAYSILLADDPNFPYITEETLPDVDRWVIHIPQNIDKYEKGYKVFPVRNVDEVVRQELGG